MQQILPKLVIDRFGKEVETPDVRQQAGRDAKGDHVRQRIQLFSEVAGRVGHAGDTPIEGIEGYRKQDGYGRPVQVHAGISIRTDGCNGLGDSEIAGGDVADRKKRWKQVHSTAQPSLGVGPGNG